MMVVKLRESTLITSMSQMQKAVKKNVRSFWNVNFGHTNQNPGMKRKNVGVRQKKLLKS